MFKQIKRLILLLAFLYVPGSYAQELLSNGHFDTDIDDWNILFGRSAVWDERDSDDITGSGSALLTHQGAGNNATQLILAQCVPIVANQPYRFGADVLVPTGQGDAGGSARIFINTYASTDCTGDTITQLADDSGVGPSDDWQEIGGNYIGEAGVLSARVAIGVTKSEGVSADTFALFDAVFFGSFRFSLRTIEGIWVNPAETSGQGLMFDYGASLGQVFLAWFTDFLDTVDPMNPQGRRLLTSLMLVDGNRFVGTLRVNEDDGNGGQVSVELGTLEIEMMDCDQGQVRIQLNEPQQNLQFAILPLEQFVNADNYICETMEMTP